MTDWRNTLRPRPGEVATTMRFVAVGIGATLTYLAASLLLLETRLAPQWVNLLAFAAGLLCSYLGHYFFTYRSSGRHLKTGPRFGMVTVALIALCSAVHQLALWNGLSPRAAAFIVAALYPPLSFMLNHFWAFSRRWGHDGG